MKSKKKTLKKLEKEIKKGVKRLKKNGYSYEEYCKVRMLIMHHGIVASMPENNPDLETVGIVGL